MKPIIVGALFCLIAQQASAGDAIAIGYNNDGVWTAVTYNRSSTPKGGPHYRKADQACTFAMRDLRVRANDDLVRTKIIGQSDLTGYVAIARGRAIKTNKDVTAIGRGKSQTEADENALEKLNAVEAAANEEIFYRYFSYGSDSAARHQRSTRHAKRISASPART
jgi:hypothetical protein